MLLSLFVALTITPYLGYIFLKEKEKNGKEEKKSNLCRRLLSTACTKNLKTAYRRQKETLVVLGDHFPITYSFCRNVFTKSVAVKMLPFDNKNEFQVVIDMPEGTTLERTAVVTKEIAQYLATRPEVVNYQTYVGTSAPIHSTDWYVITIYVAAVIWPIFK